MLKRLFSIITISLVITGSFFSAYNIKYPVYADSTTDQWTQVTSTDELVKAFQYYCESRDLTIDGSRADAITTWTTRRFNQLCIDLGIDITALQAHIKKAVDGNIITKFLFDSFSIQAYNRIFAQFLQDYNLNVGDKNVNDNVYDGYSHNGTLVYVVDYPYGRGGQIGYDNFVSKSYLLKYGTPVGDYNSLGNMAVGSSAQYNFLDYSVTLGKATGTISQGGPEAAYGSYRRLTINGSAITFPVESGIVTVSHPCYVKFNNGYIVCCVFDDLNYNNTFSICCLDKVYNLNDNDNFPSTTINIVSTEINNNTYEGDTIINNPDGGTDPEPDIPDPNPGPTPDPPTIPDSGGWQDFSLPEMPNDWLIYGMEKKFPFDIPFNIMFALSLLNHEPEIPKFEGDIDLKVCTWHYDIDLTPFDDIATILRRFEVLAFIIGLAILTKELINWG